MNTGYWKPDSTDYTVRTTTSKVHNMWQNEQCISRCISRGPNDRSEYRPVLDHSSYRPTV